MASSDSAPPCSTSSALNEAFVEYEAQLVRTMEKRLKGRQGAVRYNRRRCDHELKRLRNAKIIFVAARKDDNNRDDDGEVNGDDEEARGVSTSSLDDAAESTTTPIDASAPARQRCLQRLCSIAREADEMRGRLKDAKDADERLEVMRRDPRRRKLDVDIDDIVKELEDIDSRTRRGNVKMTGKGKS